MTDAERQRRARARNRAKRILVDGRLIAPLPADRHGTQSTFNNWGCQCDPCRTVNRNRQRADRERAQRLDRELRARLARAA